MKLSKIDKTDTMNCADAKKIDIATFLDKMGYSGKSRGAFVWYLAPYRKEITASLSIDTVKNVWADFATGETGDITDLVKLMFRTDTPGALKLLYDFDSKGVSFHRALHCEEKTKLNPAIINQVLPLESKSCCWYLKSRNIRINIAKLYVNEIYYSINGNSFYSVAFKNDKGGYAIRNKYFKGAIAPNYYTTIKGNNLGELNIFEGFINFLSALCFFNVNRFGGDTIILNSLVNLVYVLPLLKEYEVINSFLDNDRSGIEALNSITEVHPKVIDRSKAIHEKHKDFNDFIMSKNI